MIRKTAFPPVTGLVFVRNLRWGNTYIASDDSDYHPLDYVDMRRAIVRGETSGVVRDEIAWRALSEADVVEIVVHPDCYDSGRAMTTFIVLSMEAIDDRFGELALGSDCDDCVWAEVARAIRIGEKSGYVDYRAEHNALDRRTLSWERA